jgi:hypothetical protein
MFDIGSMKRELLTQNNRATYQPLYVVFQKDEIVVDEEYGYDRIMFFDAENQVEAEERQVNRLQKLYDAGRLPNKWDRFAIRYIPDFVTAFFTMKGADDFIKARGHRLNQPYVYVASLNDNSEMISIREYFMKSV